MKALTLGIQEARWNWRRNAIFGVILLLAIGTQLFTALVTTASRTAVDTYGAAVYGYDATYVTSVETPLDPAGLAALNERFRAVGRVYPWFRPVTAYDVEARVRHGSGGPVHDSPLVLLRAVSEAWPELTPSVPHDDVWRTVTSPRRLGAAVLLSDEIAAAAGLRLPATVDLLVQRAAGERTGSTAAATDGAAPADDAAPADRGAAGSDSLLDLARVPAFGSFAEPNKRLSADGFVSQNVAGLLGLPPQRVSVYWRCDPARCADATGLVSRAARGEDLTVQAARRIDETEQFAPLLAQTERSGGRFAVIVVLLGALAVAVVATAFIEVRGPQFAVLRTLGASRATIAGVTLVETGVTAIVVAAAAVVAGVLATFVDPNRFNQIDQIELARLVVPVRVYAQTAAITLGVGLVSGFFPALKAYRSVR